MDDVVAIKVSETKSKIHFFLTWGRIFDRVNPEEVEALIRKYASTFGIKKAKTVTVCDSLQEAAKARYFYEAFFHISQEKIPLGKRTYEFWRIKMKKQMRKGREIYYCGITKK